MDFEGQKLAEIIFHILIITFGAIGWVIGYFQQDFTVVFQAWLVGLVLSVIVRHKHKIMCFVGAKQSNTIARVVSLTRFVASPPRFCLL